MSILNTSQVLDALASRHDKAWAFLPQVREAAGFGGFRICDALAMSLWPSRGLEIHGFEIKANRQDWLRELKNPAKADAICAYCDRWWLAVGDKSIVKDGELPPTWGLMVPRGHGLAVSVKAPKFEKTEPLNRDFLAAILRRAAEEIPYRHRKTDDYNRGVEDGKKQASWSNTSATELLKQFRERVKVFEDASGVSINGYNGQRIGEAVKILVKSERLKGLVTRMDRAKFILNEAAELATTCADSLHMVADGDT